MARTAKPWYYQQTGWWMAWIDGKKVKLAQGKKSRKQAQDRLDELRYEAAHNPAPESSQQTVASVIERYIEVVFPRLAKGTTDCRTGYLQDFAEAHGWRMVSACRKDHMQQWLQSHPTWQSDWTKRSALRIVQGAFNWAADAEIIAKSPFRGIKQSAGPPRRDMTYAEFRAILRATGTNRKHRPTPAARFRQVLIFLWFTGCRPIEAGRLRWSDIDLEQKVIVLRQHKTIKTQRTPKPRIIPLDPVVVKLLIHIRKRNEGERVFLTHKKTPWQRYNLGLRLRRARAKAGVPDEVKLYGVRHAFGTRAIVNGLDIKTLATLMGHETTTMTEHYLHLAGRRDFLAASMQRVNGRRSGA